MADEKNPGADTPTQPATPSTDAPTPTRPWLRRVRLALMILGPALLIAIALWYYLGHRGYVSTEDAFVQANIVRVSPRVAGRIVALPVHDHEHVQKGQILLKLDPSSYKARVAGARAQLAAARDKVAANKASYQALSSQIQSAKDEAAFLEREVNRNGALAKRKVVTHAKLDKLVTQFKQAKKKITVLEAQRDQVLASLGGNPDQPVKENSRWLQAKANLKEAQLDLDDTTVTAPADGVLGHVGVRVGDTLNVGQAAFPLVETRHVWVKANFKETALTNMQPGQPVTIAVDSYPDHTWKGQVQSISPASGEVFSLLPPQNASGNWVKVVQRIPVRISLDDGQSGPILRAGMSVEVTVNVSKQPDQQHSPQR